MVHDQAAKLRRKLAATSHPRTAKTIAVVSGKGGVGKSNVALNFSLELQNKGKKVLIFDLDVGMGNIDILMGLDTKATIVDMFSERIPVHDIIEYGPLGIAYAAAGSGLNDLFTLNESDRGYFFQQYEELIHLYDYIIFDMGAGATKDSLSFVVAADECIVITTPEPTAITDAYGMVKHILNNQPDMPVSVIMNRAESMKQGQQTLKRFHRVIMRFLNTDVRQLGILPDDKAVTAAVTRQTPYVIFQEKSSVSKAIREIATTYLLDGSVANGQSSASFLQRLKKLVTER